MPDPATCRYSETHEWHHLDGKTVTIGLSEFAVKELTDITYVELPEVGRAVAAGDSIGEVESVKATSEVYSGVSGTISEVNQSLLDDPSLLNREPQGSGWLVRISANRQDEVSGLMDYETYASKHAPQ